MWKRIAKSVIEKVLDTDEFKDLAVSAVKSIWPDLEVTDAEKTDLKGKLIGVIRELIS